MLVMQSVTDLASFVLLRDNSKSALKMISYPSEQKDIILKDIMETLCSGKSENALRSLASAILTYTKGEFLSLYRLRLLDEVWDEKLKDETSRKTLWELMLTENLTSNNELDICDMDPTDKKAIRTIEYVLSKAQEMLIMNKLERRDLLVLVLHVMTAPEEELATREFTS